MFESRKWVLKQYRKANRLRCKHIFIYKGHFIMRFVDDWDTMAGLLCRLVANAWFCEKFKVNLEFTRDIDANGIELFFENYVNIEHYRESSPKPNIVKTNGIDVVFRRRTNIRIGEHLVPPESGYKTVSKLSIKSELEEYADEYVNHNAKGDWVAVHYRGTDIEYQKEGRYKHRYKIELQSYIIYLKEVLDSDCRIFACSDQAQFIDRMHATFPGRIFARDIQRSSNHLALHKHREYRGPHQKKDAFMDILVLARAKLIYTTGSGFVDIVRFFNPQTRIISLDGRKRSGNNYLPIPRKDLFDKLSIK